MASASKPARSTSKRTDSPAVTLIGLGVIVGSFLVPLLMRPSGFNPFGPPKVTGLLLAAFLVAMGYALRPQRLADAVRRLVSQPLAWGGLAFVAVAVLATITSVDPSQSVLGHYPEYQGLLLMLTASVVALGAFDLAGEPGSARLFLRAAAVTLVLVGGYATLQYFHVDPVSEASRFGTRRVRSTLGNSSNLGVYLVMLLPFAVAGFRRDQDGLWKTAFVAGGVLGTAGLIGSLSRGAWVAAIAGVVVWLLLEGRSWDRPTRLRVTAIAAAAILVLAVGAAVLVPNSVSRVSELLTPTKGTPGWRLQTWALTAGMIADRPVLGYGPASFRYVFPQVRTAKTIEKETSAQVVDDPHNLFMSVGVAMGLAGLATLLWLLGGIVVALWRSAGRDAGSWRAAPLGAALLAGTVALQFHFFTLDLAALWAVLAASILGLEIETREVALAAAPSGHTLAARIAAVATAVVLGAGVMAGLGLIVADAALAEGFGLARTTAPWARTKVSFDRANQFAPWEPSFEWARARGATQALQRASDPRAIADVQTDFARLQRRLPADPLVVAQAAEAYLVVALSSKDVRFLNEGLVLADRAIELDPQNGYRWETRASLLLGLNRLDQAEASYLKATALVPRNRVAWRNLAILYERLGKQKLAKQARARAERGR